MTAVAAWREGIGRVNRAPGLLLGVWLATLLVSLPLALVLRQEIAAHLGSSLAADAAARGVNFDWWQEFSAQASGLATTFRPTIIGFGAVLDNLSAMADNEPRPLAVVLAAGAYLVLWLFLSGGLIDRYARDRPTHTHGFFAASGTYFCRFLRLGLVMGAAYGLLFGVVHGWLFGRVYARLTRDLPVERTAFLVRVALYAVFGLLVVACNLVFDYAKVRAVVEDRRGMIGAVLAAWRFVARSRGAAVVLYGLDAAVFVAVLGVYAVIAPGAGGGLGWTVMGWALSQLYVLARLWVKLTFWASEAALFQGRLAHAGYVATPAPVWPESPAAEAISLK